jgi:hypothetical protein
MLDIMQINKYYVILEGATTIIFILYMGKLRQRKVSSLSKVTVRAQSLSSSSIRYT